MCQRDLEHKPNRAIRLDGRNLFTKASGGKANSPPKMDVLIFATCRAVSKPRAEAVPNQAMEPFDDYQTNVAVSRIWFHGAS
jgi:hypothetical protein